jgi:hypothetical protein
MFAGLHVAEWTAYLMSIIDRLTTNTIAEVLISMRILTRKTNLATSRYWRIEMTQKCFFFDHLMSNHGRECDNSNLASTLQTVHITGVCTHNKNIKTLRPYRLIS